MSVCVVAQYPWPGIEKQAAKEHPGAIVCTDTRVTQGSKALPWLFSKQRLFAPNILVCYTSNNAPATTLALNKSWGARKVKTIGETLRSVHDQYGGITELIAVVWRRRQPPSILELMPPDYRPEPRSGIVGIGDPGSLAWFKENLRPAPEPPPTLSAKDWDALERAAGGPLLPYEPPPYIIDDAALNVGAAIAAGIDAAGGPTVAWPIQVMTVQDGDVKSHQLTATEDMRNWETITADSDALKLAAVPPPILRRDQGKRSAIQLL